MAEALGSLDMTDLTAWACAWVLCLLFAGLLAWVISGATDEPTGRHRAGDRDIRPILVELAGQRRPSWDRDESAPVRPLNTLPMCSALQRPIPVHLLRRTIVPKPPILRGHAVRVKVQEAPYVEMPPPATVRVVPLWVARHEEQQQAIRRRALNIPANQPDPGYTYPGAQVLAGAVA
ncbi:hypothetical protein [Kitasatospora atroaurantiaca]